MLRREFRTNYVAGVETGRRIGESAAVGTIFPDRMEPYFSTSLF